MARIKLTAGRIRDFATNKAQAFLWDADVSGFALRATAAGSKAFVFQGKLDGRDMRVTIGDVRSWGIDTARAEARRMGTLIDQGIDPRQEKAERLEAVETKRVEARRQDVTVAEAWGAYLEARKAKWSERTLYDHIAVARTGGEVRKRGPGTIEPGPLASLMLLMLSDLTADRVSAWLEQENTRRPTRAALAYRLMRAFIRWAAGMPEYQTAAHLEAVGSRVARDHLHRVKAKEGDCFQREQLPAWFKAVRELSNPVQAAYLQALLLTGTRREELAGLRWEDVDFQWKSLHIADKVE